MKNRKIGKIQLPVTQAERLIGNDQDAMDVLFDMKMPNLNPYLRELHERNIPSVLIAISPLLPRFVVLMLYEPIEVWLARPTDMFILYSSPSLAQFLIYFSKLKYESAETPLEILMVNDILKAITRQIKLNEQSKRQTAG